MSTRGSYSLGRVLLRRNTLILRTPGGWDWKITKGTRQGDFGCDIFHGVYDIPLKKYVSGRQPINEVMKLEGQKIDVSAHIC